MFCQISQFLELRRKCEDIWHEHQHTCNDRAWRALTLPLSVFLSEKFLPGGGDGLSLREGFPNNSISSVFVCGFLTCLAPLLANTGIDVSAA